MSDARPIGIFDSGLGGLTVARAVARQLPGERIVYLGDTARVPYGTKSAATVSRYARECAAFLRGRDIKALVVACNTASSLAMEELGRFLDPLRIPLLGVIEPGAVEACRVTRHGRIGVIGTPATIRSGAYERAIARIRPDVSVAAAACPLFVPLVEEGWTDAADPAARAIARRYLAPLVRQRIDTLILGCTHYPLLSGVIAAAVEEASRAVAEGTGGAPQSDVALVDASVSVARDLARLLAREGMAGPASEEAGRDGGPRHAYFVTDDPERFRDVGVRFLGHAIEGPASIDLSAARPIETGVEP